MSNDIIERAHRIERERARRKALAHLPAIDREVAKARREYREASQKARALWVRLCKRAGVDPGKVVDVEALSILHEDDLNKECRAAVADLNNKTAKFAKLLRLQTRIRQGHR